MQDLVPVLDRFFSQYLGCDISKVMPGRVWVVPSDRRETCELHYANVFPLWLLTSGNRCVASVQRSLEKAVQRVVSRLDPGEVREQSGQQALHAAVSATLHRRGGIVRVSGPLFCCSRRSYRPVLLRPCRQVEARDIPGLTAAGLYSSWLDRSVADGTCYAAYHDEDPVSLAGTWEVPHMAREVADIWVPGTLPAFRREGYGKSAVACATQAVMQSGRIPVYLTSDLNLASTRTARAVGYAQYGWQLRFELAEDA
jgi:hypothetical protein